MPRWALPTLDMVCQSPVWPRILSRLCLIPLSTTWSVAVVSVTRLDEIFSLSLELYGRLPVVVDCYGIPCSYLLWQYPRSFHNWEHHSLENEVVALKSKDILIFNQFARITSSSPVLCLRTARVTYGFAFRTMTIVSCQMWSHFNEHRQYG